MKLAISGASGKTGYRIAEEALKNGHKVRLILRNKSVIPKTLENCDKSYISLMDNKMLDKSIEGSDALIIATGARPSIDLTGPAKIDAIGVRQQVASCKRLSINRVILVSSLCSGRWIHPLNLFGLILIWKRIGEKALEDSNLEWTIIRPGGLTEQEDNLNQERIYYSATNTQEEGSIPRRLVARTCIEALTTKNSIGKIIEITSSQDIAKKSLGNAIRDFSPQSS